MVRGLMRLLLVERVLPEKPDPDHLEPFLMDLNMLVNTGGKERTEAEYEALLDRAGWRRDRVVETDAGQFVLESVAR